MAHVSDIKLIRTDTTLDLSQKAEKVLSKRRIDPKGKIALEPPENHEKSQRGSGSFEWLVPGTQVWELEGQLMRAEVYLSIATMKCNRGRDGFIKELSFYGNQIRSGSVPLLQAVEFVEAPGSLLFHVLTWSLQSSVCTCVRVLLASGFYIYMYDNCNVFPRIRFRLESRSNVWANLPWIYVPDDLRVDGCDPGYGGCHEAMMRVVAIVMIMAGTLTVDKINVVVAKWEGGGGSGGFGSGFGFGGAWQFWRRRRRCWWWPMLATLTLVMFIL
ncbi:hypothetical protein POTOM_014356 [Populus tomentosa]|uniref:Uncharacterized protein n=1 Tax=Populus tomentosa TaxID=118781 RepID=A0A8X8AI04_POPTO|nr:hypothetical protein POTOM_014356 [Populus tomentosa]